MAKKEICVLKVDLSHFESDKRFDNLLVQHHYINNAGEKEIVKNIYCMSERQLLNLFNVNLVKMHMEYIRENQNDKLKKKMLYNNCF